MQLQIERQDPEPIETALMQMDNPILKNDLAKMKEAGRVLGQLGYGCWGGVGAGGPGPWSLEGGPGVDLLGTSRVGRQGWVWIQKPGSNFLGP